MGNACKVQTDLPGSEVLEPSTTQPSSLEAEVEVQPKISAAAETPVVVQILCEVYSISLREGSKNSTLLVAADALHFDTTPTGLSIRVGVLDLHFLREGVMEVKELPSGWAFIFPRAIDEMFSVQVYPTDQDSVKVQAILSMFGQLSLPQDEKGDPQKREYQSKSAESIMRNGIWLAEKLVKVGDDTSSWIEKKGASHVDGKEKKTVRVSENTQKALDVTRSGASEVLKWTRVSVSFACAAFKVVGGVVAEATRKTGALDKLKPDKQGNEKGSIVMEVGMASVDAALDVYHAVKKASDVVTDQTERTAVQVAGDLYGDDARKAAAAGVGAIMDVGRAGAKIAQIVGDETDLALQCATEFADHAVSIDIIMAQKPILEGKISRRDPITFQWSERYASLCDAGLLLFKEEAAMQSRDSKQPPSNMISSDDVYSLEKCGTISVKTNLKILTRDHVIHEFDVRQDIGQDIDEVMDLRDIWYDKILMVQQNSHRYKALEGRKLDGVMM